jgi:divalent metal cation (Fe/Co/Zn/Cd) transporter
MVESTLDRQTVAKRGIRLSYFTIAWNSLEGLIAVVAGAIAGSISLVGFGISLRIVGICFLSLAVYVAYECCSDLIAGKASEHSIPGIILACISLVVMPILSRAKKKVGYKLRSAAMNADARQTDFCVYLSAILLGGLLLNALLGWWWADPAAALIMVPIIAKEGVDGIRGKACCDPCS